MKHKNKKTSGIYEFLDASGLLSQGSNEEIEKAKKKYWEMVRKGYKRNRRKECKSYTIFLTADELKVISPRTKKITGGMTNYIKQTVLAQAKNKVAVDKKDIGEIREALVLHYGTLERMSKDYAVPQQVAIEILQQAMAIETKLLDFLQQL